MDLTDQRGPASNRTDRLLTLHDRQPRPHCCTHRLLRPARRPSTTSATTTPLLAAIDDETINDFNDGDIVEGVIVKVDRDEVLLDIGYKTEGVIPPAN